MSLGATFCLPGFRAVMTLSDSVTTVCLCNAHLQAEINVPHKEAVLANGTTLEVAKYVVKTRDHERWSSYLKELR